jgi:transketolase
MRDAFIHELTEIAVEDSRVMVLTGDLGYKLFDDFSARCPGRFLNMGVSEANMVSVAAGLALSGKHPATYSIAPFATVRCLEQIRNDVCNMHLTVLVVGAGGGYAYGANGPTHHGVDDVAVMRAMPGMTVLCPCDPAETRACLRAARGLGGPAYLRLGRNGEPELPGSVDGFTIGRPRVLRPGRSVALLACGPIAAEALGAARGLVERGLDPLVASVHTVKPIQGLVDFVDAHDLQHVFIVEEHGPCGGLAEALAVELGDRADRPTITRICAPDEFVRTAGSQPFMRRLAGIDAAAICGKVARRLALQP